MSGPHSAFQVRAWLPVLCMLNMHSKEERPVEPRPFPLQVKDGEGVVYTYSWGLGFRVWGLGF